MRILTLFETISLDVRIAIRGLLKNPGFLVVVILSLALGIAANSTIFSVVDTLLYRPLPYPQPEKLVVIWQTEQAHPDQRNAPLFFLMIRRPPRSTLFPCTTPSSCSCSTSPREA